MTHMIIVKIATNSEKSYLNENYRHISQQMFERKFVAGEYMVIKEDDKPFGWLRWGYFWDEIPMMNMLNIDLDYRNRGYGKQLVTMWEKHMLENGHTMVMTSTLSNESAQHFYRKLGYKDSGGLLLPNEALEILFTKNLSTAK